MKSLFMRYPGGRLKALTLSYDDGVQQDARLIEIMQEYGLKGTFNINSGLFAPEGTVYAPGTLGRRMTIREAEALYSGSGMEVAVHGVHHPFLEELPGAAAVREILEDRQALEQIFGGTVRGMAYPYGTFSDAVVKIAESCGIAYSRTTISTGKFDLPGDWLRLNPTCHHTEPGMMALAREFMENQKGYKSLLYYLWGHTFEFERDDNWESIQEFARYMGNRPEIWYATNIEIYDYVHAWKQLIWTADGSRVYNPTQTELWFQLDGRTYAVAPGQTLEPV